MRYFIILLSLVNVLQCCNKVPLNNRNLPSAKGVGDNGYRLAIGNDPKGYEAGKIYNLFLLGSRTHTKLQQFTHFILTAQASTGPTRDARSFIAGPKRVGRFQLFSDSLTKFHEHCVNTVSEADDFPKTEVQVMWVAPATGSGCVILSAMVFENPESWYSDDGALTKVICEKKPEPEFLQGECCACDEAKYNFIFEGIWSNETHPKDFPHAVWLTHFSDIIGASHDTNFSFWGENHIASDGFRSLAEWGSVRQLEAELRGKGPKLRTLIKAAGLWYPRVNANTTSNFRVDRKHHKVSLASMFGPSPDWVVGVSGLNLCSEDCSWVESADIDLYPWDSGTDHGISYMSPNSETQPRERMHRITTLYPEDPRAPFYNPKSKEMVPLAKLYIRRDKVIHRNCDDDFLLSQVVEVAENTEEVSRPECETTSYTSWTPCSVSCGKGIRMRTRDYLLPEKAAMFQCNRQLISKEMCVADIPECDQNSDSEKDSSENLAVGAANVDDDGEGIGVCKTTKWTEWAECSASCGIGISMRTRTFLDHMGRKKCPHVSVVEKEKCMKPECSITDLEVPDPMCPVTSWSDWSPCSVSCGKGVKIRTRLLLVEPELQAKCKTRLELNQQKPCSDKVDCVFDMEASKELCSHAAERGPCRGEYRRFAFSSETSSCVSFVYGGCRGNKNNFLTHEDCMQTCQLTEEVAGAKHTTIAPVLSNHAVDCVLSDWTEWTPCSVSCGAGRSEKYRNVLTESKNGGVPCSKRIVKRRKCTGPACN